MENWWIQFKHFSIDYIHTNADLNRIEVKRLNFIKNVIQKQIIIDTSEEILTNKAILRRGNFMMEMGVIAISSQSKIVKQSTQIKVDNDQFLYVILPYFNFAKTKRRTQLFLEFLNRYKNVTSTRFVIVEATVDEFILPNQISKDVFMHLKYKYESAIWCKENLINLSINKLTSSVVSKNWQYVAWIDADISFVNKNWSREILAQLKHYDFVQPFKNIVSLGPKKEKLETRFSAGYMHHLKKTIVPKNFEITAPGYALACTRWAYEETGGLIDFNIVGGGDSILMFSLMNQVKDYLSLFKRYDIGLSFYAKILDTEKIYKNLNISLSYINGTIAHHWHGSNANRQYLERKEILRGFDPKLDLVKDSDGILNLSEKGKRIKGEINKYFSRRNEDNT